MDHLVYIPKEQLADRGMSLAELIGCRFELLNNDFAVKAATGP